MNTQQHNTILRLIDEVQAIAITLHTLLQLDRPNVDACSTNTSTAFRLSRLAGRSEIESLDFAIVTEFGDIPASYYQKARLIYNQEIESSHTEIEGLTTTIRVVRSALWNENLGFVGENVFKSE